MIRIIAAILAAGVMAFALVHLRAQTDGLEIRRGELDGTPLTAFVRPGAGPAPAVVIAHGFAGSQQLMLPFATTLARAGYVAVTYDMLGHARNPAPLTGDVATADGATAALLAQMAQIVDYARTLPEADGEVALLGHSMASDIVVREAIADPAVAATVAVSLFSPEVTATEPRNLLVVTGALEAGLTDEALRVAGLAAGAPAAPFTTTGDFAAGTARRAVLSPSVEHVGVLYSATSLTEATDWLNRVFGRDGPVTPDARGGWLGLWFAGALGLGWASAPLLPRLAPPRPRQAPRRRAFFLALAGPALVTPFLAALLPEGLLPAPIADYLTAHFLIYGLVTGLAAWRLGWTPPLVVRPASVAVAALALALFALVTIYLPVDRFVTAFAPLPARLPLLATLFVGLLPYFLADEALTRSPEAPRFAYALSKLAFLLSLGLAIALDPPRLFFLILILPVMLIFFLVFGQFSRWSFGATGSPWPAALANAALFAWAIAVTFPILGD